MKNVLTALACAALLSACGPQAPTPPADNAGVDTLAQPTAPGRKLTCALSYLAVHGPLVSESRAQVKLVIENGVGAKGWTVESVEVVQPLPDAQGFDPWLQFLPGVQRQFVSEEGATVTLDLTDGAPLTLNRITGDLKWRADGPLGGTEYTGACR